MSTARKIEAPGDRPSLRERAKASRTSADRIKDADGASEGCMASRLGEILEEAQTNWDSLDQYTDPHSREAVKWIDEALARRIDDLELAVSFARADSPLGMLVQLAVAHHAADLAAHGSTAAIRESAEEQVGRCILSVAAALCAMTGLEREHRLVRRYIPACLDKLATPGGGRSAR